MNPADPITSRGASSDTVAGNGHVTPQPGPGTPPLPPFGKRPWYRSGAIIAVAAVAVVVGASVIADLPKHNSTAQQASQATTVIKSVDTGIHPCTYAVSEAFSLYQSEEQGTLTASERSQVPGLMNDDAQACSFANQGVVNISTITLPNSPAGRELGTVIDTVYKWMTSDAVGAMDDLETLLSDPHDAAAKSDLAKEERLLAADRTSADRGIKTVERALGGAHVPDPALPRLPGP